VTSHAASSPPAAGWRRNRPTPRLRRAGHIGLLAATRGLSGGGPAELTLRTEGLAVLPVDARTVLIVENETTHLAFPLRTTRW
jgi:hypothetical protein